MLILKIFYGIMALLVVALIILAHQIDGLNLGAFYGILIPLILLRGLKSYLLSDMIVRGSKKSKK